MALVYDTDLTTAMLYVTEASKALCFIFLRLQQMLYVTVIRLSLVREIENEEKSLCFSICMLLHLEGQQNSVVARSKNDEVVLILGVYVQSNGE